MGNAWDDYITFQVNSYRNRYSRCKRGRCGRHVFTNHVTNIPKLCTHMVASNFIHTHFLFAWLKKRKRAVIYELRLNGYIALSFSSLQLARVPTDGATHQLPRLTTQAHTNTPSGGHLRETPSSQNVKP